MAVVVTPVSSSLQISVQAGTDSQGRPVIKKRAFGDLKAGLTDQQVFDLAGTLAGLLSQPMVGTQRMNQVDLA